MISHFSFFADQEQSSLVSVSGDQQFAEALSAHPQLRSQGHQSTFSVDLDGNLGSLLSKDSILSFASKIGQLSSDQLCVFIEKVEFRLDTAEDHIFLAELAALDSLLSIPATRDARVVALGISGLRGVSSKYGGISSQQYLLAVRLIDQYLAAIHDSLVQQHGQHYKAQLLLLGSSTDVHTFLAPLEFNKKALRDSTSESYTVPQINSFQIQIWFSLVLLVFLIGVTYVTCTLDSGKNTILYRVQHSKIH